MKPMKAKVTKGLQIGSYLVCADNSGAKKLQLISVKLYKGRRRRRGKAGVGDTIKVSVKEGDVKIRKQVLDAVIIRQKAEYRRPDGTRISFEDNAAVIVNEKGEPRGTQVKGPMAKEVTVRYLTVGKIASTVV